MDLIEILKGQKIYFDTNIFIYFLEGNSEYKDIVSEIFEKLIDEEFEAFSSSITLTEILPPLVKRGDEKIISSTIEFIRDSGIFKLVSVDDETAIQAGFFRGTLGMKTPDALHVASAIQAGCAVFLTNDIGIRVPKDIKRIFISDFV